MSHIVEIKTEVRDPIAIGLACQRLQLPQPRHEEATVFSEKVTGFAVRLRGWDYPIVCNTNTGEVKYDNFGGYWGDKARLDEFLQRYAVEKAKLEARRRGHSCAEQTLSDGRIRLTISIRGAA